MFSSKSGAGMYKRNQRHHVVLESKEAIKVIKVYWSHDKKVPAGEIWDNLSIRKNNEAHQIYKHP